MPDHKEDPTPEPGHGQGAEAHDPDTDFGAQMTYESADLDTSSAPKGTIYFFGFVLACIVVTYVFMRIIAPDQAVTRELEERRRLPEAAPLLQSNATARQHMIEVKENESEQLNSYGWANVERTRAHIPIDEAMRLGAEMGNDLARLPVTGTESPRTNLGSGGMSPGFPESIPNDPSLSEILGQSPAQESPAEPTTPVETPSEEVG